MGKSPFPGCKLIECRAKCINIRTRSNTILFQLLGGEVGAPAAEVAAVAPAEALGLGDAAIGIPPFMPLVAQPDQRIGY